ncbi:hypothetical protein [Calothrix sp. CCY 0018]|uniref:hypothetical protein n=1 Tax=Calothrix sp. CCY 0018 TaxID=3103864 RepID=UPI0039C71F37
MALNVVVVSGNVRIVDDEVFRDEVCTATLSGSAQLTSEGQPSELVEFSKGCGGEVRAELDLNCVRLDNGDVKINGEARLYEGTSENTGDLEDTKSLSYLVPKGRTITKTVKLRNTETFGGDTAKFTLTLVNIQAA